MPRRLRYHHQESDSDEFETPALREAERENRENEAGSESDDDFDEKSESGLGDSPEEEMIEENADSDEADDDSDDAPEDVGFASSRDAEKKRMQSILQQIKRGRDDFKEKRKKRDELFKMQKQDKLAALSKRKLPAGFLEAMASKPAKQKKGSKGDPQDVEKDGTGPAVMPDEAASDALAGSASGSESDEDGSNAPGLLGDFVPLTTESELATEEENVAVIALNAEKRRGGQVPHNVADFRQKMLYSSRIKRVSAQQARATRAKRKART